MAADITMDGLTFISSKRASELSGYTQDYIGQLARTGKLVARRIGGLWYVVEDSLLKHKETADAYVPIPPAPRTAAHSDSVVTFDGKAYTSATKAAKACGYHPDYVTQLARSEKIDSRHVGNRWYVDLNALRMHKKEKDALLAEVQSIAVGIRPGPGSQDSTDAESSSESLVQNPSPDALHFTYERAQSRPLLPTLSPKEPSETSPSLADLSGNSDATIIPIRVVRGALDPRSSSDMVGSLRNTQKNGHKTRKALYTFVFPVFFVSAVLLAYYFRAFDVIPFPSFDFIQTPTVNARIPALSDAQDAFEDLFSRNIEFVRTK